MENVLSEEWQVFDIAKNTLTTIGLDCPIWLIGIGE